MHGISSLFIVEGTMNAVKCIEMLNSCLKPQIKEQFGGNTIHFRARFSSMLFYKEGLRLDE